MYLKLTCNLEFPDIGSLLAPDGAPDSFDHDSEDVYEWMYVKLLGLPFSLNVSREHGWADIDDETESTASPDELKTLVNPGPVYMFGWNRSSESYVDALPEWLPQFVADRLNVNVLVYNRRINVDIPAGEPVAVVRPQGGNANNKAVNGSRR